jgi:D-proline reductase (dithiol) PrdB
LYGWFEILLDFPRINPIEPEKIERAGCSMVRIADMDLKLKLFMRGYPWRRLGEIASAVRAKPLAECRVALVSSAGLVAPGQEPYDPKVKGGDWSWRSIPADIDVQNLTEHHRSDSWDHKGIAADRNMGMPLDRLRELAADGAIGGVAPRHISVMGSITATGRFIRKTVPEIVEVLTGDEVDVALMVPV